MKKTIVSTIIGVSFLLTVQISDVYATAEGLQSDSWTHNCGYTKAIGKRVNKYTKKGFNLYNTTTYNKYLYKKNQVDLEAGDYKIILGLKHHRKGQDSFSLNRAYSFISHLGVDDDLNFFLQEATNGELNIKWANISYNEMVTSGISEISRQLINGCLIEFVINENTFTILVH